MIVLWCLLFVLVLTMISGARELMTPGAWEKKGLPYKLAQPPPVEAEITARYEAIRRLGDRLLDHAGSHGGAFPATIPSDGVGGVPSPPGGRYVYAGGRIPADDSSWAASPLAYEPASAGPDRLVLMRDGNVRWMPATEIERVLTPAGR